MPDQPNVDAVGAGGTTNPPVSKQSVEGAEQLSGLVKSVVREVLTEELKPIKGDISGLYSRQDKQNNTFSELLDEFKTQKANGLSDADAQTAAEKNVADKQRQEKRDAIIDKLAEQMLNPSSAQPAGNSASGVDAAAKVLEELKLDAKDAEVAKKLGEVGLDNPKLREEMAVFALQHRPQTTTSPAQSAALKGGASSSSNVEEKIATLQELQKRPSINKVRIAELTAELEAANWGG